MSNNDVKNQILSVLDDYTIGTLATIQDEKPYSRFMMFFHEDLVLYTATNKDTHKVEELEKNPYVHILLGYDGQGWSDPYVEVEAKVNVETNEELKKKFWNEKLKEWIKSPDDPNYLLLQLTPKRMRYFDKAGSKPKEI
ncbi:pyridoxamine 5'-phosphate oxidase family protein [Priestia aryabhattai]|uniref:pyridoxamine 5'-phosphate oxidase family protein n=1 Tax=Priestia aryabhattai TaxID=412384 RepID=UPI001C8E8B7E|nr:pyridoxamine 5'-phosphate oxidase family protein [Priestia aryabhattai]MBX9971257.1 pyridoxamine 5'-phosphate oxidase family protein [Priestia aryabhattai]